MTLSIPVFNKEEFINSRAIGTCLIGSTLACDDGSYPCYGLWCGDCAFYTDNAHKIDSTHITPSFKENDSIYYDWREVVRILRGIY